MFVECQEREKTVQGGDSSCIAPVGDLAFLGSGQELVNNIQRYVAEIIYIFIVNKTQEKPDVGLVGHKAVI